MGKKQKQWQILFSWAPKSLWMVTAAWNWKMLALWKKSYDKPRYCIKKQKHHFANKGPYSESYGFSSSRVCMWELDHKEDWATKNWCFWIVALKKTLKSPLNSRRSNQSILREKKLNILWKDWCWNSNTLATWCKELAHWQRPWSWERLRTKVEEGGRGWYG